MGHKKRTKKDMHQQAYDRFTNMLSFGDSKREDILSDRENGTDYASKKIYSYQTYKTYWKHTKYFIKWVAENYPECKKLDSACQYVPEWLQTRVDQGLSSWTIHTEEAALNKLYGIKSDDPERFIAPKRCREDIKRSRVSVNRDRHFSKTNNDELIRFCQGTGLRRSELVKLKGKDLVTRRQIEAGIYRLESIRDRELTQHERNQLLMLKDASAFEGSYFVYVRNGKGGKQRVSPIIGNDTDQIVSRMKDTSSDELVWKYVNSNADIHSYRAEYATAMYKSYAREIEDIPIRLVKQRVG